MDFSTRKSRRAPAVIIIALIDVLLVVLIFLMVTTTFRNQLPALKLSLPESERAESGSTETDTIVLTVAREAPFFHLGNQPVSEDELLGQLMKASHDNPKVHLSVRGDEGAPWGMIIKVMDMAREAKIESVQALTKVPGGQ